MSIAAASLFDRPAEPVLGTSSSWIEGVLGGTLATSLCVIAIAILGLLLLAGRLRVRRSTEVVLGCFLLLGAGLLAAGDADAPLELGCDAAESPSAPTLSAAGGRKSSRSR